MIRIFFGIVNGIIRGGANALLALLSLLPETPFRFGDVLGNNLLGYINYFVPLGKCISLTVAWLSAIAVWYGVQIALRWVKAID